MNVPKLSGGRCQCTACGQFFNRVSLFDKHRQGKMDARTCLTPDEMADKGWRINAAGFWVGAGGWFAKKSVDPDVEGASV